MKVHELKNILNELQVPKRWYSINGTINSDIYVLNEVYGYWEYFYIDEKGNEIGRKKFEIEDDACNYFLEKIKFNIGFYRNKSSETAASADKKIIYL